MTEAKVGHIMYKVFNFFCEPFLNISFLFKTKLAFSFSNEDF